MAKVLTLYGFLQPISTPLSKILPVLSIEIYVYVIDNGNNETRDSGVERGMRNN